MSKPTPLSLTNTIALPGPSVAPISISGLGPVRVNLRALEIRSLFRRGPSLLVSSQGPSGRYDQPGSVSPGLLEFAVPTPGAQQLRVDLLNRRGKDRL